MTEDEGIYADCPEDDIYEDLEVELKKAGYAPQQLNRNRAPALPDRNSTINVPPNQPSKEAPLKKVKKTAPVQTKKKPTQDLTPPASGAKPGAIPRSGTAHVIPADMLGQRRLLKKVERIGPSKIDDGEPQTDFRSALRKVNRDEVTPKKPPPVLKPKPSRTSISEDTSKIRYKRVPLSQVDLTNPPVIDRDKKPRLTLDAQYGDDDEGLYDDVVQVMGQETYDDVENVMDHQEIYDDVENQNPDMNPDEYYDDVENLKRAESPGVYDDVENVGITRKADSPDETYDDVCVGPAPKAVQGEEVYDEVPDISSVNGASAPRKGLTPAQEKKRKLEEQKFRKKQLELEKKRQKELEKSSKELEKKRKVFMEYYNLRESDKPLMVAQVASLNDLKGKQNLHVEIGDIVHVICKEHKKMPKGAWLAEKSDKSTIGFIAPSILNQNILPTFDDY